MVSLIRASTKKYLWKESWQTYSIILRIFMMLHTKMWKCIVTQINSQNYPFCGPHSKPHGAKGLSKHYHLSFDPKLGNGVCEIFCIPCACIKCTPMLNKPWIYGISSDKQERYKTFTDWTYCPLLGPFNNWNIIQLSQKSTPYDAFDGTHQVVFDAISENMSSFV